MKLILSSLIIGVCLVNCAKQPKPVTSKTPFMMPYQTITVR